jgi:hypothetical protein
MTLHKSLVTAVVMSVIAGTPAWAQHRGGTAHGQATARSASSAPAPRAVAPSVAPRPQVQAGRTVVAPSVAPRVNGAVVNNAQSRAVVVGQAVPRSTAYYRGNAYYARPYYYGGHYHPVYVAPVHFYHPYYAFHPHVSVGFGLWLGYPVPYSYAYYNPYPYYGYPYPYPYASPYPAYPPAPAPYPPASYPPAPSGSYPPAASGSVQPQVNMGGLSFEIEPSNAELIIDGNSMGTVGQFTPSTQPLGLPAGRHHVEVRAAGYQTMSFDVDIVAGQVLPYRGTMER